MQRCCSVAKCWYAQHSQKLLYPAFTCSSIVYGTPAALNVEAGPQMCCVRQGGSAANFKKIALCSARASPTKGCVQQYIKSTACRCTLLPLKLISWNGQACSHSLPATLVFAAGPKHTQGGVTVHTCMLCSSTTLQQPCSLPCGIRAALRNAALCAHHAALRVRCAARSSVARRWTDQVHGFLLPCRPSAGNPHACRLGASA
jgi:hypothetical protein